MKLANKITAAAVLLFISVCSAAALLSGDSGYSETEKRELSRFPELSWDSLANGRFGSELVSYTADHFAGRSIWTAGSARIESSIGESIVNGVFISDSRLLSAEPSYGSTEYSAVAVNNFVESYSGAVCCAAIPTSAGIYGDMLPSYLLTDAEKQQIDNFYSQLSRDIKKIDAYSILKMLSDNYIYYRSDEKWTCYGAYCVYRTVIQKLGFQPVSYDKYTIHHVNGEFRGNLYSRSQFTRAEDDLLDVYTYQAGAEVSECLGYDSEGNAHECSLYDKDADGYDIYFGGRKRTVKIKTTVNNDRRLLVIGDDFAACFVPFLTQHYSEIAVVFPDKPDSPLPGYINKDDYEQTLFLFGINTLKGEMT